MFAGAGWAPGGLGGESSAVDAGALNGHRACVEVSAFVLYLCGDEGWDMCVTTLHTHVPLSTNGFRLVSPCHVPDSGTSFEGVSEPVLGDGSQGLGPFGVLGFDASCPGFVSELEGVFLFHAGFEFGEGCEDASGEVVGVLGEGFLGFFESDGVVVVFELFFNEFYFVGCPADA